MSRLLLQQEIKDIRTTSSAVCRQRCDKAKTVRPANERRRGKRVGAPKRHPCLAHLPPQQVLHLLDEHHAFSLLTTRFPCADSEPQSAEQYD